MPASLRHPPAPAATLLSPDSSPHSPMKPTCPPQTPRRSPRAAAPLTVALLAAACSLLPLPLLAESTRPAPAQAPAPAGSSAAASSEGGPTKLITLRPVGHRYEQVPLPDRKADTAYICLGGFGDEIGGIVWHLAAQLRRETHAPVAYYHWHGGQIDNRNAGIEAACEHIRRFRSRNPQADILIIGHSMGAASGLLLAKRLLSERGKADGPTGRVCLLTLDPADRTVPAERPEGLAWWGNAYIVHSQSARDFIPELGGRWNHCSGADLNIRYDGRRRDEHGRPYIHDDADALLMSRRGTPAGTSLREQATRFLSHNRATVSGSPSTGSTSSSPSTASPSARSIRDAWGARDEENTRGNRK